MAERDQLAAELAAIESDAAWTALSDDQTDLAESRSLTRQADALRRAVAELDRDIADAVSDDPI